MELSIENVSKLLTLKRSMKEEMNVESSDKRKSSGRKSSERPFKNDCPPPHICRNCGDAELKNTHASTHVLPYWRCKRYSMPCECAKSRCSMMNKF